MKNTKYSFAIQLIINSLTLLLFITKIGIAQDMNLQLRQLPIASSEYVNGTKKDWLVEEVKLPSKVLRNEKGNEIILSNGLISRTFRISPNAATITFKKLYNQEELVRAVKPEATVSINNFSIDVGGLVGQPNLAFLYED